MKYSFSTLFFEATRRCNLSCSMCMAGSNDPKIVEKSVKQELTTDEVEELVLKGAKKIGVKIISWSGGEFVMREDAEELVRRATKLGFDSTICTNATKIDEEKLRVLNEASGGSLVIAVGINSISDENFWTRDNDNACTLELLDLCDKVGVKKHVIVNVGRHNLTTIKDTLQWLDDRNIPYNRSPFTARGSGMEYFRNLACNSGEMEETLHPELRKHANGYISYTPFFLSPELHDRFSEGQKNVTVPQNPSIGCWIGTWLSISAEGDVSPCGILLDAFNCGNVREKPLDRIIDESERYQDLLDRNRLKGKCGRCRYKFTCGGCRAMAYFNSGDIMGEDPNCFFEPVDETTVSEHEEETNRNFRKYTFMERYAGHRRRKEKAETLDI